MNEKLENIKKIDSAIGNITIYVNKLAEIMKIEEDIIVKKALSEYILLVSYMNYKFMVYLMTITSKNVKKHDIDKEFNKIMKDLFKNDK